MEAEPQTSAQITSQLSAQMSSRMSAQMSTDEITKNTSLMQLLSQGDYVHSLRKLAEMCHSLMSADFAVPESGSVATDAIALESTSQPLPSYSLDLGPTVDPTTYSKNYDFVYSQMLVVKGYMLKDCDEDALSSYYNYCQTFTYVVPRLYCLIVTGMVAIEKNVEPGLDIASDILTMCHSVQNPLRGLYVRKTFSNFLFSCFKIRLNEFDQEDTSIVANLPTESKRKLAELLCQNLCQMFRFFVRFNRVIANMGPDFRDDVSIKSDISNGNVGAAGNNTNARLLRQWLDCKRIFSECLKDVLSINFLDETAYKTVIIDNLVENLIASNDNSSQYFFITNIQEMLSDIDINFLVGNYRYLLKKLRPTIVGPIFNYNVLVVQYLNIIASKWLPSLSNEKRINFLQEHSKYIYALDEDFDKVLKLSEVGSSPNSITNNNNYIIQFYNKFVVMNNFANFILMNFKFEKDTKAIIIDLFTKLSAALDKDVLNSDIYDVEIIKLFNSTFSFSDKIMDLLALQQIGGYFSRHTAQHNLAATVLKKAMNARENISEPHMAVFFRMFKLLVESDLNSRDEANCQLLRSIFTLVDFEKFLSNNEKGLNCFFSKINEILLTVFSTVESNNVNYQELDVLKSIKKNYFMEVLLSMCEQYMLKSTDKVEFKVGFVTEFVKTHAADQMQGMGEICVAVYTSLLKYINSNSPEYFGEHQELVDDILSQIFITYEEDILGSKNQLKSLQDMILLFEKSLDELPITLYDKFQQLITQSALRLLKRSDQIDMLLRQALTLAQYKHYDKLSLVSVDKSVQRVVKTARNIADKNLRVEKYIDICNKCAEILKAAGGKELLNRQLLAEIQEELKQFFLQADGHDEKASALKDKFRQMQL